VLGGLLFVGVDDGFYTQSMSNSAERLTAAGRYALVKFNIALSPPASGFRYQLTVKKGKQWGLVSEKLHNTANAATGSASLKLTQIFGRKPIVSGKYRLEISVGSSNVMLYFTISQPKCTCRGSFAISGRSST